MGASDQSAQAQAGGAPQTPPLPPKGVKLTPEQAAARGKRNVAIALSLLAFVVLIFFVTYVRLTSNIETRILDKSAPSSTAPEVPAS